MTSDAEIGRLLTIGWYWPLPYLSQVREISYDHGTRQLVTNPIPEYDKLRTGTVFERRSVGKLAPKEVYTLPVPATQAGAVDVLLSLNVSTWAADDTAAFGLNRSCSRGCEPFIVLFDVGAADADGDRTVRVSTPNTAPGTPAPNCAGHYGIPRGCEPGTPRESVRVLRGEALSARFMVDGPLMEVFVQGGRMAFSLRYTQYPPPPPPSPPAPGPCEPLSLEQRKSASACTKGRTFGCIDGMEEMWVDKGCNGIFKCNGLSHMRFCLCRSIRCLECNNSMKSFKW